MRSLFTDPPLLTFFISLAYPMAFATLFIILLWARQGALALAFLAIALVIAYAPHLHHVPTKKPDTIRVISSNVRVHKTDPQQQAAALLNWQADVIGLLEINEVWINLLPSLQVEYPYTRITPQGRRVGKIAYWDRFILLSKWPVTELTNEKNGYTLYQIQAPTPFYALLAHPTSPFSKENDLHRHQTFKQLSEQQFPQPLVVFGDFNATPWDPPMRQFVQAQGLKYASRWLPTFRPDVPVVPIDHILHSAGITPTYTQRLHLPMSDHYAQLADFTLN